MPPAAATGGLDVSAFYQLGAIGVACLALSWFAYRVYLRAAERAEEAYRREASRADRLEAELLAIHKAVADRIVPAVEASNHAVEASDHAVAEATQLLRDLMRHRAGT